MNNKSMDASQFIKADTDYYIYLYDARKLSDAQGDMIKTEKFHSTSPMTIEEAQNATTTDYAIVSLGGFDTKIGFRENEAFLMPFRTIALGEDPLSVNWGKAGLLVFVLFNENKNALNFQNIAKGFKLYQISAIKLNTGKVLVDMLAYMRASVNINNGDFLIKESINIETPVFNVFLIK